MPGQLDINNITTNVTFTYTLSGHVHGPDSSGHTRIAGIWREDASYTDNGTTVDCSTNDQAFYATS